jgi:hypothetical protein
LDYSPSFSPYEVRFQTITEKRLLLRQVKLLPFALQQPHDLQYKLLTSAKVAELADAPDLGSGG